jgi:hypothetical protein
MTSRLMETLTYHQEQESGKCHNPPTEAPTMGSQYILIKNILNQHLFDKIILQDIILRSFVENT